MHLKCLQNGVHVLTWCPLIITWILHWKLYLDFKLALKTLKLLQFSSISKIHFDQNLFKNKKSIHINCYVSIIFKLCTEQNSYIVTFHAKSEPHWTVEKAAMDNKDWWDIMQTTVNLQYCNNLLHLKMSRKTSLRIWCKASMTICLI